jgi:parvulin-like peptidyl-prolyl isomerase
VASVNGEILRADEYQRALEALASDRREPLGPEERRHVLDRLLDEELLVQRGLELGLARHDRRVRGDIVAAVIQSIVAQSESDPPDETEVERFYQEQRGYFARSGRLRVRRLFVRPGPEGDGQSARARAEWAAEGLAAGEPFERMVAELGDEPVAPLPDALLPAQKLREYLGPSATRRAMSLEVGGVSEPLASGSGWQVLQLVDREVGFVPPLAELREEVRAELLRRRGDTALRDYLDALRERADLRLMPDSP